MTFLFSKSLVLPATGELIIVTPLDLPSGSVAAYVVSAGGRTMRLKPTVTMHVDTTDVAAWNLCEIEAFFARDNKTYRLSGSARRAHLSVSDLHFEIEVRTVERFQRRNDFRVFLDSPTRVLVGRNDVLTARIIDLSAGGVLLVHSQEIPAGQRIEVEIPIDGDGGTVMLRAEVLVSTPDRARHKTRCTFDNGSDVRTSSLIREQIAHYVFQQERAILKVRKLVQATPSASTTQRRQRSRSLAMLIGRRGKSSLQD